MQIDDDVFWGGLVAAVAGFLGWILKVAAASMLKGFTEALNRLTLSVDEHRKEMTEMRLEMERFSARLKVLEDREGEG